ncbi:hypothetical protein C0Z18_27910 [Trinickia dabaoshanensis]|uniref:Uncharacterized protein n=1 Tax=Trinickia dabaoshanensis TaxID=564714 RepID=A0A2N7VDT1_9BURK|nr:hypothetical protein [Trinickia dabaoshanensis]PMS15310.1 hypothetical protein C0Z18_27910 [Trinickia dabaoshanensis]
MSKASGKPQGGESHEEQRIDHGVDETFPASDPPAVGGATRIDPDRPQHRPGEGGGSEDNGGSDDTPSDAGKTGRAKGDGKTSNPGGESESDGLSGIAGLVERTGRPRDDSR